MSEQDRVSGALARFIRWVMRDTKFHKMYPCTVQSQSSDLTRLELLPDDEEIRGTGTAAVLIRHGLPGVTVKVPRGARVLLGFAAGDERRPYAALWEPGSIESISFAGGTKPVARMGDSVTCFWPPSLPVIGTLPAGAFVGTLTITSPSPGIIQDGRAEIQA